MTKTGLGVLDDNELQGALTLARTVADEACEILMAGYRTRFEVRKKGAIDLVTEFDLRAEHLVRERLESAFPDHRIVGEEGDARGTGNLVWYVDPLDGTTNFAHGHPTFSVSIALYDDAVGLLGVVAAPALGVRWWAARGTGCYRNGEPCHVSPCSDLGESLCATGFPYDRRETKEDNLREFGAFIKRAQGVRRGGSAAIDLAMVADGTFDAYWEQKLSAWDMCAGAVLVREAGGTLSDYLGGSADPRKGALVATNGHLHAEVLALLDTVRRG